MAKNDVERYERAMKDAFQQLDWVIGYLQGIHKEKIARALAKNREYIAQNIAGEEEAALPTEQGGAGSE